jgi:hypothetical protein
MSITCLREEKGAWADGCPCSSRATSPEPTRYQIGSGQANGCGPEVLNRATMHYHDDDDDDVDDDDDEDDDDDDDHGVDDYAHKMMIFLFFALCYF